MGGLSSVVKKIGETAAGVAGVAATLGTGGAAAAVALNAAGSLFSKDSKSSAVKEQNPLGNSLNGSQGDVLLKVSAEDALKIATLLNITA